MNLSHRGDVYTEMRSNLRVEDGKATGTCSPSPFPRELYPLGAFFAPLLVALLC